ncbi:MAG TPA: N-6 DNA methylase, partial [Thermodesulfobacteriota bacterium]|nr:N-6 DNA methylase [Thermodesulfobacteriota bacterium]
FALHTYYALLIKLVASLAAARFAAGQSAPLSGTATLDSERLKMSLIDLERGGLFREYGIRNFLEGDFFGWYLAAWEQEIEEALRDLIKRLAEYDPGTLELAPENARDLLKKLYHYLLPREIRHDLGEYYTPDWLAERLIRQTLGRDLGDPTRRVLDPSCGSGTFLVLVINHIKREAQRRKIGPTETLETIRNNVIGFDLNPLAVIAARTNYILALGDLLKDTKHLAPEGIDIPIYQCDSVLTPTRGRGLFDNGLYKLKTSVGIFDVPGQFATKERMEVLANVLDEAVESHVGEDAFLERLSQAVDMYQKEFTASSSVLINLYRHLADLHRQGLNGVWARIIKNSFAPLFLEPVHYIVGNPPWVNWESLPDDYRIQTKPLWEHYGLFPHGGMDTILGKGKKDISMLMTYVSVDKYLLPKGKLGFVLSQSLFKTSGAGQGFRRFILPDKTPIGPLVVEDMVELKPFEGATNRTSIAVVGKGYPVRYPVSYSYWVKKKGGRGSAIGFDTPYEEVTKELITFRSWQAEPVNKEDKTSAWITARPKALKALHNVLGKSVYTAHEGANTGGANSVYWVEVMGTRPGGFFIVSNITEGAKKKAVATQAAVEQELLYPLLRGRDVSRWSAKPSAYILMTQDPQTRTGINEEVMKRQYPKAYAYLQRFKPVLRARKTQAVRHLMEHGPFYAIFGVGKHTMAKYKVVWPWISTRVCAAVVGIHDKKVVIPEHNTSFVAFNSKTEAHYFCAAFDSAPCEAAIIFSYGGGGGGIAAPSVLERVVIPTFSDKNPAHLKLAELSETAHKAALADDMEEVMRIEEEIDLYAAKLWDLSEDELAEIKRSLEEV